MRVSAVRIGAAALALALVVVGFILGAPWLALVAVLVVIVAVAFST